MLGHRDRDHQQLLNLVAHRVADRDALALDEAVTALAIGRPVLDYLVDRPRRQQRTTLAQMPRLAALPAPRRVLAALGHRARRIHAGRLRTITRTTTQPPLQLHDPLTLARNPRRQALDLRLQTLVLHRQRQQHRDHRITTLLEDRLRLDTLHPQALDAPKVMSPNQLNAYAVAQLPNHH
jgi:hypothetical protein